MDGGTGIGMIDGGSITADRFYVGRHYLLNQPVGNTVQPSTGTFSINSGGTVTANSYVAVGYSGNPDQSPGATGTLNINGGTLHITGMGADAYEPDGDLRVGVLHNAIGQMNVAGGTIDVANDVIVGHETGHGTVVFNGGLTVSNSFYLGYGTDPMNNPFQPAFTTLNATGSFTVNGGTINLGGDLGIGMGAAMTSTITGLLTINAGAVTTAGQLILGDDFGSKGTIQLNGGSLKVGDASN